MDQKTIARELEQLVYQDSGIDLSEIASWAYEAKLASSGQVDQSVLDTLEELSSMDMGPEFEWTEADLKNLVNILKQ